MDATPQRIDAPAEPAEPAELAELAEPWAAPEGRHPARTYLDGLAPSGRRSQRIGLEQIARRFSNGLLRWDEFPWHRLRYEHASRILSWLKEAYPSPATANNYRSALRGVLRECWRLRYLDGDEWMRIKDIGPAPGSREPRGRAIESEEMARLFQLLAAEGTAVATRDAAWMAVVYSSGGVRLGESLELTVDDFDAQDRHFRVIGKGNKERRVWLGDQAAEALHAWLRLRGTGPGYVFLPVARDRTTILHGKPLAQSTMREMCARRAGQAGIPHLMPHDFRRTSISDFIDQTGDLSMASELAGHANRNTTGKYDRRGERKRREAARRMQVPYVAPGP